VLTLEALGYVERQGKTFRLRPQILELGYSYLSAQPWWRHGQSVINDLGRTLGCACAIGVLDRGAVAYLAYTPGGDTPQVVRAIGTRLPAAATALGRVLLAHQDEAHVTAILNDHGLPQLTPFTLTKPAAFRRELAQVRSQDFACVYQQLEVGLFSVGIALRDRGNQVFAALSASHWGAPPDTIRLNKAFLIPMRRAAEEIRAGLPT
jgi:IclR family pca regulon transcriptional regulator